MGYLANSVRTRGVGDWLLASTTAVRVVDTDETLAFVPVSPSGRGLIFICGSGVAAEAYGPLLRPVADAGYAVHIVKLPYRFAPFEAHKIAALGRVKRLIEQHPEIEEWVIAGHSLGGALAARTSEPKTVALVLIGTTHPKRHSLASLRIPITKVYATNDGIAPPERTLANRHLLPSHTKWMEIRGGNHSQFGHYGHQLFDGNASVAREEQQAMTRAALLEALKQ
jgi:pimeloyl-ACP methyl ester carboxylesterase